MTEIFLTPLVKIMENKNVLRNIAKHTTKLVLRLMEKKVSVLDGRSQSPNFYSIEKLS